MIEKDHEAIGMLQTTYCDHRTNTPHHYLLWGLFFALLSSLGIVSLVLRYRMSGSLSWVVLVSTIFCLVVTLSVFHTIRNDWSGLRKQLQSSLSIDEDGLTCTNWAKTVHWSWRELSHFELVRPGGRGNEYIRYRPNALRWHALTEMHPTRHGLEFRISDTFDAPLAEIAARLNEYRDRAMGAAETSAD